MPSCGICRERESKYTCPRCNLPYCSLACYKDASHSACQNAFHAASFASALRGERADDEDRKKIAEILERAASTRADDESVEAFGDTGQADDLAYRFGDLDIDNADAQDLWSRLTPSEQQQFLEHIGDSAKANNVLLENVLPWTPWWEQQEHDSEADKVLVEELDPSHDDQSKGRTKIWNDHLPPIAGDLVPFHKVSKGPPNPAAAFNILDLLLVYAFVCRRYDGSIHDTPVDVTRDLLRISETASNPSARFESVTETLAVFRTKRVDDTDAQISGDVLELVAHDALAILRDKHRVLSALSDMRSVLQAAVEDPRLGAHSTEASAPGNGRPKFLRAVSGTERKCWWFACWISDKTLAGDATGDPYPILRALASDLDHAVKHERRERMQLKEELALAGAAREQLKKSPPKIELLGEDPLA